MCESVCVSGSMSTFIQLLCASKRCSGVQGQSPWSRVKGEATLKLKHLAFGRAMETANLPVF